MCLNYFESTTTRWTVSNERQDWLQRRSVNRDQRIRAAEAEVINVTRISIPGCLETSEETYGEPWPSGFLFCVLVCTRSGAMLTGPLSYGDTKSDKKLDKNIFNSYISV